MSTKKVTKKKVVKKVAKKVAKRKAHPKIDGFVAAQKDKIVVGPALARGLQMDTLKAMRKVTSWLGATDAPEPDIVGLGNLVWGGKLQVKALLKKRRMVVALITPDGSEQVFSLDQRKGAISALSSIFS